MRILDRSMDTRDAVWLIDADHWPRALLRAELIERGYDAIGFETVAQAIARLALDRRHRPRLVVIDLAGQQLTETAFKLLSRGAVPVIGLGRAVTAPSGKLGWTDWLQRPVSLGEIADAVDRVLRPHRPAA
jgi:DNA-binding NtrC family response regulator